MGDFLSKELSQNNKWWIPKYRYLELRYFCLQYPDWVRKYEELKYETGLAARRPDELRVNASKIADRTAEIAMQRKLLADKIHMVEQTAIKTDPELYVYILRAVTENLTFSYLKAMCNIPCERDMFYDRRRKFFWLIDRAR